MPPNNLLNLNNKSEYIKRSTVTVTKKVIHTQRLLHVHNVGTTSFERLNDVVCVLFSLCWTHCICYLKGYENNWNLNCLDTSRCDVDKQFNSMVFNKLSVNKCVWMIEWLRSQKPSLSTTNNSPQLHNKLQSYISLNM